MQNFVLVFIGAGLGGALRHAFNLAFSRWLPATLGASTLTVNVFGSLLMGLLIEWLASRSGAPAAWRVFLATGVLGGFTTFSAFSLDAVSLYQRGQLTAAALYVLASVILSLLALFAGVLIARQWAA
jgi:CrcB protein